MPTYRRVIEPNLATGVGIPKNASEGCRFVDDLDLIKVGYTHAIGAGDKSMTIATVRNESSYHLPKG